MTDDMRVVVSLKTAECNPDYVVRNSTDIPCVRCEELINVSPSGYTQIQLGAVGVCLECAPDYLKEHMDESEDNMINIGLAPGAIQEMLEFETD